MFKTLTRIGLAGLMALTSLAHAAETAPESLRIGYQKGSISMVLAKSHQLLEKRFPDYFLRCHQSYLINPDFASSIERFKLTMSDGFVIPIPEKKYTQVKRLLLDFINARSSDAGI